MSNFDDHLRSCNFTNLGFVVDALIERSPETAEDILDNRLQEVQKDDDTSAVKIDFTPFRKSHSANISKQSSKTSSKCTMSLKDLPISPELTSAKLMIESGHRRLVKHPVTESLANLKWQQLRKYFFISLLYRFAFAVLVTWSVMEPSGFTKTVLEWIVFAMVIPMAVMLIVDLFRLKSNLFLSGWKELAVCGIGGDAKSVSVPMISFEFFNQFFMIPMIVFHVFLDESTERIHFSSWAVFQSWLHLLFLVRKCPTIGIYVYILEVVVKDVVTFIFAILSVLLGFVFAFSALTNTSISSLLHNLTLGHLGLLLPQNEDRIIISTEILFAFFLIVVVIGAVNILIGISVANVGDALKQEHDFKLGQMILNAFDIEHLMLFLAKIFHNLRLKCLSDKLIKACMMIIDSKDESVFIHPQCKKLRKQRKRNQILPMRFGNDLDEVNLPVFKQKINDEEKENSLDLVRTCHTLPGWIWKNIQPVLEERKQLEEDKRKTCEEGEALKQRYLNINKGNEDECHYMCPDWVSEKDTEPYYETVNPERAREANMLKESILKELRKDLSKFIKIDKFSSDSGDKSAGKSVNVRPGLALGVITLQAGTAQNKGQAQVTVH